jgi:tripartite ATP-independent transporter DctP family solute receptor
MRINYGTLIRIVLVVAFCIIPVTGWCATEWKLAHKMSPDSIEGKAYQLFADQVAKLSNGKMKVTVYHSEQLGAVGASLDMVRKGTLQMYIEGIGYAHPFVPQLYYCSIPFVYRDRAHMLKFMKSDMVKKWQEELTKKSGLDILGEYGPFVRGPYRVLVSKRPILTLADLKGLKLRMYKNEMVMNLWKELGANITYIAWTEVYDGLKRGLIEAVTSPIALVESMHFQEVAKYLLHNDEYPASIAFFVNHTAYQKLPNDLKSVLLKAYEASCKYSQEMTEKAAEESIEKMIKKDKITFIRAPMDDWWAKAGPILKKWESERKYGLTPGVLDYINGL